MGHTTRQRHGRSKDINSTGSKVGKGMDGNDTGGTGSNDTGSKDGNDTGGKGMDGGTGSKVNKDMNDTSSKHTVGKVGKDGKDTDSKTCQILLHGTTISLHDGRTIRLGKLADRAEFIGPDHVIVYYKNGADILDVHGRPVVRGLARVSTAVNMNGIIYTAQAIHGVGIMVSLSTFTVTY